MKKFTKLFLSCAAMAAVTAAVATTAMAAPALEATYDAENTAGTLALTYTDVTLTGETTVLVSTEALTEGITDDKILYIDQAEAGAFGEDGVVGLRKPAGDAEGYLPDGKYYVYVGYTDDTFKILSDTFTVGQEEGTDMLIGDINLDDKINTLDITPFLRKAAGRDTGIGHAGEEYINTADSKKVIVGDINLDEKINTLDITPFLRKAAGRDTGIGHAGETVTVVPAN